MKVLSAVFLAASTSLLPAASWADNFNYNYLQLGATFNKTEMEVGNQKPDLSGKGFNAQLQYSPTEGVYVKGVLTRGAIDRSKRIGSQKIKVDGKTTTIGALAGVIVPLAENVDFRAGLGLARVNDSYKTALILSPSGKKTQGTSDRKKTGLYGESGLKFGFGSWGDLDLLYTRLDSANYFSIGGNTPITENFGIEVGYTFSPKGKNRDRFGAWNVGARFYF